MHRRSLLLAGLALWGAPAALSSQHVSALQPGERIRATISVDRRPGGHVVSTPKVMGTLVSLDPDSLVVRIAGEGGASFRTLHLAQLEAVEVSAGHMSRGQSMQRGALRGMLVGAAIGGLVSTFYSSDMERTTDDVIRELITGEETPSKTPLWHRVGRNVGLGASAGIVAGSLTGLLSTERWRRLTGVPVAIQVSASGRGALVSVPLSSR